MENVTVLHILRGKNSMMDFNYVSFLKKPQHKEKMCSRTYTELRRGTMHHQLTAGSIWQDSRKRPGRGSCYKILSG